MLKNQGVGAVVKERISCAAKGQAEGERPMLLFPEGTTTNGRYLLPFKSGAFLAGCPLQPVILQYKQASFLCFPGLQAFYGRRWRKARLPATDCHACGLSLWLKREVFYLSMSCPSIHTACGEDKFCFDALQLSSLGKGSCAAAFAFWIYCYLWVLVGSCLASLGEHKCVPPHLADFVHPNSFSYSHSGEVP